VRLAEKVGVQPVGPDPAAGGLEKREWFRLRGGLYEFVEAEPVRIVGHPEGRPMQLSIASPGGVRLTPPKNRVRYATNTESGSSGSPVFNKDWRIVALHHAAGPTPTPGDFNMSSGDFNQGIPMSLILEDLRTKLAGTEELRSLGLA
jgi:endonuclease G